MVLQLYQLGLPDASAGQPQDRIGAQVQQQGLIQGGGTATEKVATSNVDLQLSGQWPYGERFTKKVAREGLSLSQSGYEALPLFNAESTSLQRKAGYYEVANVDVSPAHETSTDDAEYTVSLNERGTRSTHWRAVRTSVETVDTLFTGSDNTPVAIPIEATKERWYDSQQGTETATEVDTFNAEFGALERYFPSSSSFTDPTLIFELPFERDGPVDVTVWDDRNRTKEFVIESSASSLTDTTTQWSHVYHTAWEFDGSPVIDTGRLRVYREPPATNNRTDLYAEQWDEVNEQWDAVTLPDTTATLIDIDFMTIGPAQTRVQLLWADGTEVEGVFDRGAETVLWIQPDNVSSVPSDILNAIEPIARKTDTNIVQSRAIISRSEVRA